MESLRSLIDIIESAEGRVDPILIKALNNMPDGLKSHGEVLNACYDAYAMELGKMKMKSEYGTTRAYIPQLMDLYKQKHGLTFKESVAESVEDSEDEYLTPPEQGDDFAIEIDDYCLESNIIRSGADHIVLECDDEGFAILESAGLTLSEEQLDEAEYHGHAVKLNKPQPGDVAKFKVFVKDPKTGNIKKVNFGDKNMRIKKSNPARRKSFRARHKCATAKDKTTARYWSCRKW